MATKTVKDSLGLPSIEISARTVGSKDLRILIVYVEADTREDLEGTGEHEAHMLAHRRGFHSVSGEGVVCWPVERSSLSGRWQTRIEYTSRWRGRSTLDR